MLSDKMEKLDFFIIFSCSDCWKASKDSHDFTLNIIFMNSWMGRWCVGSWVFVSCFRVSALFWLWWLICIFSFGRFLLLWWPSEWDYSDRPTRADSLDWWDDSDRCESRDPDLTLIIASWIETSDSIRTTLLEWFWFITGVTGGVGVEGVWIRCGTPGGGVGIVW